MSADREEKTMRCHGAPAPPLENDDILTMILVRLPPLPSSLPRASLVCKRWRRLVTRPHFHRSFLAHHMKAPLLGFFCNEFKGRIDFRPVLDPPNRLPAARFSSCMVSEHNTILGCRHGRLLVLNFSSQQQQHLVVWDPITDERRHVDLPQMFMGNNWKGALVCSSQEKDHIHGACHSEPFQVVLIGCNREEGVLACVYSSETYTWSNIISLLEPPPPPPPDMIYDLRFTIPADSQSSLVGNSVYWVSVGMGADVIEFDLHRQTLAIIGKPPGAPIISASSYQQRFILPADGGGLSFIVLSGHSVRVWKRISTGHGVAGWLFENTVELSNLLSLKPISTISDWVNGGTLKIVGHDEDGNMIFRSRGTGTIYLVHLKTLQFKELSEKIEHRRAHPFSSFYTAGMNAEIGMRGDENV